MKKQTNTFFSKALVQSLQRYFTTEIYLQKNLISYRKGEFEPIFNEQLSLMTPSKDFKWYSTTEKYFSNDICINIDNKYNIDYMQMQDRLIEDQLDDKIIDAMIYIMMKEKHYLSRAVTNNSNVQSSNIPRTKSDNIFNPLALPCLFETSIEDENYDVAQKIFQNFYANFSSDEKFNMLLIPTNIENQHWYLMVIDLKNLRFLVLDSMLGYNSYDETMKNKPPTPLDNDRIVRCTKVLSFLCMYANSDLREFLHYNGCDFRYYSTEGLIPNQNDNISCGVFVVMNIFSILKYGGITNILQENMVDKFRNFIFRVFSHFHNVQIDTTIQKDLQILKHSIFQPNKEATSNINNDSINNLKAKLEMVNRYDARQTKNLEILTMQRNRKRKKMRMKRKDNMLVIIDSDIEDDDMEMDLDLDKGDETTSTEHSEQNAIQAKKKPSSLISANTLNDSSNKKDTKNKKKKRTAGFEKNKNYNKILSIQMDDESAKSLSEKYKLDMKTRNKWLRNNKEMYTKTEEELDRFTRIMKTKFIQYHKKEQKFYVSRSDRAIIYNNNMTGNLEIYQLHKEFIETMQIDPINGETYRQLFTETIPKCETWYDMTRIQVFIPDIQKFYKNERAGHAFLHKDFTHVIFKKSDGLWGRIYSGSMQRNILYYEVKLTSSFIEKEKYSKIVEEAKKNPGKDISVRTLAAKDQDQSICSDKDPAIRYIQGKKNMCFQYGLMSTLCYLKKKRGRKKRFPNYLAEIDNLIKEHTFSLVGNALIKKTNHIMTANHWRAENYKMCCKKRKRDGFMSDLIDYKEGDQIIMVNLVDNDGLTSHFVTICDGYIFDSNFVRALPFNIDNLSICCGSKRQAKVFEDFGTVLLYRAPKNIVFSL